MRNNTTILERIEEKGYTNQLLQYQLLQYQAHSEEDNQYGDHQTDYKSSKEVSPVVSKSIKKYAIGIMGLVSW